MLKKIKTIRTHKGYGQFLAECDNDADGNTVTMGVIPRQADIPSPYAYSSEWNVYRHNGVLVTVRETAHRVYTVFEVPASMVQSITAE